MRSSLAALFFLLPLTLLADDPPTRAEALAIARQFSEHRYTPTARNVLHGPDPNGIAVETPDASSPAASGPWRVDQENTGIPYKWGGFDSLASFDTGLRAGKAAGDLYNAEKRRQGGAAVSSHAVGIDCSGFISRCWRLSSKRGTSTLPGICVRLKSTSELLPGDILNAAGGHVVLFVRWLDGEKRRAEFYEAEPFSKVIKSERDAVALADSGFVPLRYRRIRD